MATPTCYVNRCTAPGSATGSFAGMCPDHKEHADRIVAAARAT